MTKPASIFISYRRSDSISETGRICDCLKRHFTGDCIFKDVDSIPIGANYREHLEQALGRCQVLVAVIGPTWLTITGDDNERRLDSPDDWVRIEIEYALKRNILVIPVLVNNARQLNEADLPGNLKKLAFCQTTQIRHDPDFHNDIEKLITGIERQLCNASSQAKAQYENELQSEQAKHQQKEEEIAQDRDSSRLSDRLDSKRDIDYGILRDALRDGDWQKADQITCDLMVQAVRNGLTLKNSETDLETHVAIQKNSAVLGVVADVWQGAIHTWEDVKSQTSNQLSTFPCIDLLTIDHLWQKFSNGRFGFSVQKQIWADCGAKLTRKYPGDVIWNEFGDLVGWRVNDKWLQSEECHYNLSAPRGHLPTCEWGKHFSYGEWGWGDAVAGAFTYGIYPAVKAGYSKYKKSKFGFAACGPAFACIALRISYCDQYIRQAQSLSQGGELG